ncbi:MAG: gamma-D-glutamyl-meso-diaminopimelate peptidase [Ruminococcaceae bacterium]|nr:gamma-D-glutamyl-meso-diaminopimelate peptidase [Oscillospiraceae bacterium]
MSIVRTDVPMTSRLCEETIDRLLEAYPFCRSETLTTTVFDRPIRTLVIGRGPKRVLYTAAHHANEWITAPVILKFVEDLAQAIQTGGTLAGVNARELEQQATIYTVPMVNPDGVDLVTGAIRPGQLAYDMAARLSEYYPTIPFPDGWKANLLGVDLNLNYPAGWRQAREIKFAQGFTRPGPRDYVGRAPLNQFETRALAAYTEEIDPALVLAYHSQGRVIYWQFSDIVVPGARALGERFAQLSGYTLEDTPYESAFAGYKDWFIQNFRRPGYTIEVGSGTNPLPLSQFDEIYRDNLPILVTAAMEAPDVDNSGENG